MPTHPQNIANVFAQDTKHPIARLVHVALAAIADEHGRAQTTVHTLVHMTGLLPIAIEAVLGHNPLNQALFPGDVHLVDGIVTVALAKPE